MELDHFIVMVYIQQLAIYIDSLNKANVLNHHFSSVFTTTQLYLVFYHRYMNTISQPWSQLQLTLQVLQICSQISNHSKLQVQTIFLLFCVKWLPFKLHYLQQWFFRLHSISAIYIPADWKLLSPYGPCMCLRRVTSHHPITIGPFH